MALGFFSSGAGAGGDAGCGAGGWVCVTGALGLDSVRQGAACQAINTPRAAGTRIAKSRGRTPSTRPPLALLSPGAGAGGDAGCGAGGWVCVTGALGLD